MDTTEWLSLSSGEQSIIFPGVADELDTVNYFGLLTMDC